MQYRHFLCLLLFVAISFDMSAQNNAVLFGKIKDSKNQPIEGVNISTDKRNIKSRTDRTGSFEIRIPSNQDILINIKHVQFQGQSFFVNLMPGERKEINYTLKDTVKVLTEVEIKSNKSDNTFIKLDPKEYQYIPNPSGDISNLLKPMGVASNNELSTQYSVRGGNFDENLVYVNDIEIYRPFLIHSGQQEGLSFVNSDMVQSISFSAGGFDAKYGDKMSSVLDILYKRPDSLAGSFSVSLLGETFHLEGTALNKKFTYISGFRRKTNSYILKGLETKGEYKPSFLDFQNLFTYNINDKSELSLLTYISSNKYNFIPETRKTKFGPLNQALQLTVYFDGQEIDSYDSKMAAMVYKYSPNNNLRLKFIGSAFSTSEQETYDIQGQYRLGELESDMSKDSFGKEKFNRGVGTYLNHSRDFLNAIVYSFEHKGSYSSGKRSLLFCGAKIQYESINDKLNEWKMIDSADYTIPHSPDYIGSASAINKPLDDLKLQEVVNTTIDMNSLRYTGYLQNTWDFKPDSGSISFTAGIRASYWDFNNQLLFSPRANLSYRPHRKKNIIFRFSTGYYFQPPFYHELRDFYGNINKNLKAQTSIHFVLGSDYEFRAWNRQFKWISEIYYKYLDNLVPYKVDNVRIRYYANNYSKGYATGLDMKINGEFVKGVESWASLSLMTIREDLKNDYYYEYFNKKYELIIPGFTTDNVAVDSLKHEPGYMPRPTDQRLTFNLFFQDYLPKYKTFKMHLNFVFGTGLPFGPPTLDKYKDTLRMPEYWRVDIGFSKQIISDKTKLSRKNPLFYCKSLWLSLEVFNLLQRNNTISYLWITDVSSRMYAVPNYLTSRQLNFRIICQF